MFCISTLTLGNASQDVASQVARNSSWSFSESLPCLGQAFINYCLLTNKVPRAGKPLQGCLEPALIALAGLVNALAIRSTEAECAFRGVWVGSGQLRHPHQCGKRRETGVAPHLRLILSPSFPPAGTGHGQERHEPAPARVHGNVQHEAGPGRADGNLPQAHQGLG